MRYGTGLTGRHCDSCPLLRSTLRIDRSEVAGDTFVVYTCRMRKACGFIDYHERLLEAVHDAHVRV